MDTRDPRCRIVVECARCVQHEEIGAERVPLYDAKTGDLTGNGLPRDIKGNGVSQPYAQISSKIRFQGDSAYTVTFGPEFTGGHRVVLLEVFRPAQVRVPGCPGFRPVDSEKSSPQQACR